MLILHFIVGVFTKILAAVLIVFTFQPHTITYTPSPLPKASWHLDANTKVILNATLPTSSPLIKPKTTKVTTATATSTKPVIQIAKVPSASITSPTIVTITVPPAPPVAAIIPPQSEDLNEKTRKVLVNVLCLAGHGDVLRPISGSGVIIDPKGVVLTNAHIAQFFLLRDYPSKNSIQCVLRTGSPASPMYTAELLYFPQKWLDANAQKIVQENPTGTGEYDYALLLITGRTNGSALPSSFPYISPYTGEDTKEGDSALLAAYPAGFLEGATISTDLFIASAISSIKEVFTFHEGGGIDLISVPGTVVSQKGSSGGAVVRQNDGTLTGLIATATTADSTSQRDLRAITLRHVNVSLIEAIGQSLSSLLSGDVRTRSNDFNDNTVPAMSRVYFDILNSR